MVSHLTEVIKNEYRTDGDIRASVIQIDNTGSANTDYQLINPLGRMPVGVQLIKMNKNVNMWVERSDNQRIVIRFSAANCDVNIRVW